MSLKAMIYEEYDAEMFGNQKYVASLVSYCAEHPIGLHFDLVLPTRRDLCEFVQRNTSVHCLEGKPWWRRPFALLGMVRRLRPEVILCMNERSFLTIMPAAFLWRVPLVWYVKNHHSSVWSDILCFLAAKRVLCLTWACINVKKPWVRRWFRHKTYHELNCVPVAQFAHLPLPDVEPDRPLRVLQLGSLIPRKGVDVAVAAMHALEAAGVTAELTIAGVATQGNEAYAAKVQQESRKLTRCRVEWTGWIEDIQQVFARADVVILPARSEGLGQCVAQAMAAGRPVVGSDVGGIPTLVREGETGFLFPVEDAKALADRLRFFAENRQRIPEMGKRAREFVLKAYDINRHVPALREHLEACVPKACA